MNQAEAERLCAIRDNLVALIGCSRYGTWFGEAAQFKLDGERLDITVGNSFVGNWISTNFMPHLVEATRQVVGAEPRVAVRVAADGPTTLPAGTPPAALRRTADTLRSAGPGASATRERRTALRGELSSFVVGPSNELAFSVVAAVVRAPGVGFKHVVVHGGCGLGKTHLLQGICNGVARSHATLEWRFHSGEEFTNEFVYAVKANRVDQFRARFRNVDLLVIDDIHFLANKRATQEEFLHTFNAIDACGKTVVLSSDQHPRHLEALSAPLLDRLIAATVVEINPPDLQTRREILRRRAATMLCELNDELLDYVAHRITRNVRELEGALFKLAAYSSLTKEPITLDLVRRVVDDSATTSRSPEAGEIVRGTAAHFGVTCEALYSKSRDRTVCQARAIALYLLRKHTRLSFPEMGRLMGDKRHSTALMAVRRVQGWVDHGGTVIWQTPTGRRETPAKALVEELEHGLGQRREP